QDRVGITSAGVEVEGYGKQLYLRKRGDSFTVSYKYAEPSDIDVSPALSQLEKFATNNGMTLFVTGKSGTQTHTPWQTIQSFKHDFYSYIAIFLKKNNEEKMPAQYGW
ncbi:MAG TPA: hypothetical protein V6C58_18305, partial [Allocoleopsis sp.]